MVKFTEFNISEFLNFNYISYHWEISKKIILNGIYIQQISISEIAKLNSNENFLHVGYVDGSTKLTSDIAYDSPGFIFFKQNHKFDITSK